MYANVLLPPMPLPTQPPPCIDLFRSPQFLRSDFIDMSVKIHHTKSMKLFKPTDDEKENASFRYSISIWIIYIYIPALRSNMSYCPFLCYTVIEMRYNHYLGIRPNNWIYFGYVIVLICVLCVVYCIVSSVFSHFLVFFSLVCFELLHFEWYCFHIDNIV